MRKNLLLKCFAYLCFAIIPSLTTNASNYGKGFFWGIRSSGGNFWSASYIDAPTRIINRLLPNSESSGNWTYSHVRFDNEKGKMHVNDGKLFGFKSKDMFANVQYGLHLGWQPMGFPFGIYVSGEYGFNKFRLDYNDSGLETKYKLHSVQPGIGVRIAPLAVRHSWTPILDVSMIYNYTFSMKGPFDNDKSQVNNGIRSHYGVGARIQNFTIIGGFEKEHYDRFNHDFTPDGGISYPYKNITSKAYKIFINIGVRM